MSEAVTKKKEAGMATLVIVLFAICAVTALLLGLTNEVTKPYIAANNEKTTQKDHPGGHGCCAACRQL